MMARAALDAASDPPTPDEVERLRGPLLAFAEWLEHGVDLSDEATLDAAQGDVSVTRQAYIWRSGRAILGVARAALDAASGPPTPELVERAAEAIAKQAEPMYGPGWDALSPAQKGAYRDQARAALAQRAGEPPTPDERLREALSEAVHRMASVAGRLRLEAPRIARPRADADYLAEKLPEFRAALDAARQEDDRG